MLQGSGPWAETDGAGDGIRTRDIDLGKVALYQLSYSRLNGETFILHRRLQPVKPDGTIPS